MFVAVCGSLGKTTTVMLSQAVLSQKYKTISTEPNKDLVNKITSTILKLNPSIKRVILEVGTNSADFLNLLIKPAAFIATRIISNEYDQIKKLLTNFSNDTFLLLNWDDVNNRKLGEQISTNVIYYGTDAKNCTVWAGNIKIENFKTSFELNFGVERVRIELPILGLHQVYPSLAAATLGIINNIPLTKIKIGLESAKAEDHKLQLLTGSSGSFILDDTLSANPIEVEYGVDTLVQIPARRRIIVLGEMTNPAYYSQDDYRKIAEKIYKEKIDFVFLGQGLIEIVGEELKRLGFWEEKMESGIQNSRLVPKLLKILGRGDICLIKGDKNLRWDEVVKRISKKK